MTREQGEQQTEEQGKKKAVLGRGGEKLNSISPAFP